ncbi:MAG: hypothetical protein R3284_07945 [Rubricoccaceae bacterium]|nr:hypothetical protein [Rubricoccaceae bacterium]
MRSVSTLLAFLFVAAPALAQENLLSERPDPQNPQGENMATPPTWNVRFDHPGATVGADSTADVWFVNMTPGWHITTGPAAIFYHPASTVEGNQRVESNIYYFDPEGHDREAYGLFFGGQNLEADNISYDYFVVRNTGEFLLKRRTGGETSIIHPWTAHEAISVFGPETEGTVANKLALEVHDEEVAFFVNDAQVLRLAREDVNTDGVLGFRFNHHVNVHVSTLAVEDL